ncbi:MAG: SIMPL domain-containing protein [Phycisphaerales bacterium]|nr:SIMPL domain-containing protein [Phycisphaerales bacterium]
MNWLIHMTCFAGLFAFAVSAVPAFAQMPCDHHEPVPMLTVTGQAELERPADQLQMSLAVITEDEEAKSAVSENSRTMRRVIEALERAGLEEDEYETGRFSIQPKYSRRPHNADRDWTAKIVGYRVENMLIIKTKKLELIGELIERGVQAGANNVGSINFGLADRRMHRGEAILEATTNARADADALAEAAGVKLVRVLSVNLDGAAAPPIPYRGEKMMMATRGGESDTPPIQPGDVTVRAHVTIVYEIADN